MFEFMDDVVDAVEEFGQEAVGRWGMKKERGRYESMG